VLWIKYQANKRTFTTLLDVYKGAAVVAAAEAYDNSLDKVRVNIDDNVSLVIKHLLHLLSGRVRETEGK